MTTIDLTSLPGEPSPRAQAGTPRASVAVDQPRRLSRTSVDDVSSLVGSLLGGLMFTWVLYAGILPFTGALGFLACWYAAFLGFYAAVTAVSNEWTVVVDRLMSAVVSGAALVVGAGILSTVVYTFLRGWGAYTHLNFYTHDMTGVSPTAPLTKGGILHAIVGTGVELGIGVSIALTLGIATAVFMTEVGGTFARATRTVIEAMTALPDVVAGLFIYVVLIIALRPTFQRSGFCAAIALTVMMTPIIARAADVALRVVPGGLREASLALGASRWQTVWRVVLPTARPGLATAVILGVARGIGETAPVLLTSGFTTLLKVNPLHGNMNSLPLFIWAAKRSGDSTYITRGFGAASLLLFLVLVLFLTMRRLARSPQGNR